VADINTPKYRIEVSTESGSDRVLDRGWRSGLPRLL